MNGFKYKKSVQALNFLATLEGGSINKMKALKLIWLSDRLHLRRYARLITDDTYFAMEYGPVASGTKDMAEENDLLPSTEKRYATNYIRRIDNLSYKSIAKVDELVFSDTDLDVMKEVYDNFGGNHQFELSDISHFFPEWKRFEDALNAGGSRFRMDYKDFFESISEKSIPLFSEMDESESLLSKEIFLENEKIFND